MVNVEHDLRGRGFAVHNLEYRRLGLLGGGGWPQTFDDVAGAVAAIDGPVVTVGHSAGGHLAVWAASLSNVVATVSQAGILDLREASRLGVCGGQVGPQLFPVARPNRLRSAQSVSKQSQHIPEKDGRIVTARREGATIWRERDGHDLVRVSRDTENLLAGPHFPEADLSLGVCRYEKVAAGHEHEVLYRLAGLAESKDLPDGGCIPETNPLHTGGRNEAPVGRICHALERCFVSRQTAQLSAAVHVPNAERPIGAAGSNTAAVRRGARRLRWRCRARRGRASSGAGSAARRA